MTRKTIAAFAALIAAAVIAAGCAPVSGSQLKAGTYTNMGAKASDTEIKTILDGAGLSNTGEFIKWVDAFDNIAKDGCGLKSSWSDSLEKQYDTGAITKKLTAANGETASDANCRLAAFLLFGNHVKAAGKDDYGTYLMFDRDAIDNDSRYAVLKKDSGKFTALFDEVPVNNTGDKAALRAFPDAWAKRGVSFKSGSASLVSVVMTDSDSKVQFIGHTGVLIDMGGSLLFVEKLEPFMPYQATVFSDRNALKSELLSRPEYSGDKVAPFVLENDRPLQ